MLRSIKFKQSALDILCRHCHKKPNDEFLILLCDHIICGECIGQCSKSSNLSLQEKQFNGVKCPCGLTTYFNSRWQVQYKQKIEQNLKNSRRASKRPSIGTIHSRESYHNFGRLKTQESYHNLCKRNMNESGMQTIENSSLMMQKSSYPIIQNEQKSIYSIRDSRKSNRSTNSQQKLHRSHYTRNLQIGFDRQIRTNKQHKQGKKKSIQKNWEDPQKQNQNPNLNESKQHSMLMEELQNQLNFIEEQFQRSLNIATKTFNRIIKKFKEEFNQLCGQLNDMGLERIVLNHKNSSRLDFSKLLKLRYEGTIGTHLDAFVQKLDQMHWRSTTSIAMQRYSTPTSALSHSHTCMNSPVATPKDYPRSIVNIYAKSPPSKCQQNQVCRHKKLQKKGGTKKKELIIQI